MWACEICEGERYSVDGGVVLCLGCENTFPADARLEEVTIEAMEEPGEDTTEHFINSIIDLLDLEQFISIQNWELSQHLPSAF